ncbi:hypothetical protein AJ80_07160 [Polytolypa hystricis UAMH7299]|uniref:Uncharacterized protein n=1 Tax=Polytolypa hystricis (strain UAMH7299) TaxID=1447883 RepID=A0A2B7XQZ3_POLH7|nr:hypothetical protein AJ80_07160 [Polytolypa hystricis UAMH7299]
MAIALFQCCMERRKNRNRRNVELDERYGDLSITAPLPGGWNQVPNYADEMAKHEEARLKSSKKSRRNWVSNSLSAWQQRRDSSQSSPRTQSSPPEKLRDSGTTAESGGADFVYKPASEEFFKSMAEIGKPRGSREASPSLTGDRQHRSHLSNASSGAYSIDQILPASLPRHPSYLDGLRNFSGVVSPPRSTTPNSFMAIPYDIRDAVTAPAPSVTKIPKLDTGTMESSSGSDYDAHSPTSIENQGTFLQTIDKKKQKKDKRRRQRAVTEEMVPSTTDLFG